MEAMEPMEDLTPEQVVAAIREHGKDLLSHDLMEAVIQLVRAGKFDGQDLLDASFDEQLLVCSWLPPSAGTPEKRVSNRKYLVCSDSFHLRALSLF